MRDAGTPIALLAGWKRRDGSLSVGAGSERVRSLRGGMTIQSYVFRAGGVLLSQTMMILPDGRIEQYIVERAG